MQSIIPLFSFMLNIELKRNIHLGSVENRLEIVYMIDKALSHTTKRKKNTHVLS